MKTVELEEQLIAQVKNVVSILNSEEPSEVKVMMLEMQKDYLTLFFDYIAGNLKTYSREKNNPDIQEDKDVMLH